MSRPQGVAQRLHLGGVVGQAEFRGLQGRAVDRVAGGIDRAGDVQFAGRVGFADADVARRVNEQPVLGVADPFAIEDVEVARTGPKPIRAEVPLRNETRPHAPTPRAAQNELRGRRSRRFVVILQDDLGLYDVEFNGNEYNVRPAFC